jgi:hypothetical protein
MQRCTVQSASFSINTSGADEMTRERLKKRKQATVALSVQLGQATTKKTRSHPSASTQPHAVVRATSTGGSISLSELVRISSYGSDRGQQNVRGQHLSEWVGGLAQRGYLFFGLRPNGGLFSQVLLIV